MKRNLNILLVLILLALVVVTPVLITQDAGNIDKIFVQLFFLGIEFLALFFIINEINVFENRNIAKNLNINNILNPEVKKSMPIYDVKIKQIKRFSDDRGFFSEIIKFGEETFREVKQTSYTETYPGVIKAFHWHKKQFDIWFPIKGNMQIVLHDMRKDSPTYNVTQVIYAGENNPTLVLIPPYVAHGYRVLGQVPATLIYHTSEAYDPADPDEERIDWNDPKIGFDWTTKNK